MTIKRYRPWRRAAGAAEAVAVLGLPFLRIDGESALRFGVPTLSLHFFGRSLWMDEYYLVLMGLFFLTFFFLLITVLFGRLWCGWVCPQTVLSDFTAAVDHAGSKPFLKRIAAYVFTFFLSAVVGASLVWYFVSPYEFIPALLDGSLGPVPFWSWVLIIDATLALSSRRSENTIGQIPLPLRSCRCQHRHVAEQSCRNRRHG